MYDNPYIAVADKVRFLKAEVLEVMLYGCVTWTLSPGDFDSRVVLTLGLPCLLIDWSLGYAWRVFAFVFCSCFYFFPRSGEAFSSVICSSLSLLSFVFFYVAMVWQGKPASVTTGSRDRTYVRK